MMHISYPFYSRRFKNLIKTLKSQKKLREEPLENLDRFVYLFYFIFFLPSMLSSIGTVFVFFIIATTLSYIIIIRIINKRILPCSLGHFTDGTILEAPVKENVGSGYGIIETWKIIYRFNKEFIYDKKCTVKLPIRNTKIFNLSREDIVTIGYDDLIPKNNLIVLDEVLDSSCINQNIIEERIK